MNFSILHVCGGSSVAYSLEGQRGGKSNLKKFLGHEKFQFFI